MKTGNFPGKRIVRQKGALERLKGPDQNNVLAMNRYEEEKKALTDAIGSVYELRWHVPLCHGQDRAEEGFGGKKIAVPAKGRIGRKDLREQLPRKQRCARCN